MLIEIKYYKEQREHVLGVAGGSIVDLTFATPLLPLAYIAGVYSRPRRLSLTTNASDAESVPERMYLIVHKRPAGEIIFRDGPSRGSIRVWRRRRC